jgi:hypothetical protein
MKITALMDLYRKAIYDFENRRIVVPLNLRQFDVSIYIHEIRRFRTVAEKVSNLGLLDNQEALVPDPNNFAFANPFIRDSLTSSIKTDLSDTAKFVNENTAQVVFNLNFCEFMAEESSAVFSKVSNVAGEMAEQKISWKYETLSQEGTFPSLSFDISDKAANGKGGSNPPDGNAAKWAQAAKNFSTMMASSILATATSAVASKVNKTSHEKIGGPAATLASIAATVQSVDGVLRLGQIATLNKARTTFTQYLKSENPLGNAPAPGPPLTEYNVYK